MATLADVRTAVELRLGDTTNTIWTEAEIDVYIKAGQNDLVRRTGCLWKKDAPAGLVPVASTGTYTLPTDLIRIERLTRLNKRLFPISPREAAASDPLYRTTEGDVYAYVMEGDGISTVRYVRVPAANGGASDISIEYQRRAATLSADGTSLDVPDRYADYVRHYALWKAYERDGPGQNLKMAQHYQVRYEEGIARMLKRKSQARAQRVTRLGGGRYEPPRRGMPVLPWQYGRRER